MSGLPVIRGPAKEGAMQRLKLGDMDGDGDLDVVASYYEVVFMQGETGHIGVLLNNGDGTFGPWKGGAGLYDRIFLLSDMNNDGTPDVLLASVNKPTIMLRHGDGNGGFSSKIEFPFTSSISNPFGKIVTADLNNDGYRDLVLSELGSNTLFASINAGGNSLGPLIDLGITLDPLDDFDLGDLDADGNADLVHSANATDLVHVRLGKGDGSLGAPTSYPAVDAVNSLTLRDLDNDGKLDVVVSNDVETGIRLNDGTGTLGMLMTSPGGSTAIADLNGDGHLDVLGFTTLFNNGNGTFAPQTMDYLPYEDAALGDINGDGLADIARVLDGGAALQLQMNQGNGAFDRPYLPFDLNVPDRKHMTFVDLGGSALVDLATVDEATDTVGVRMNMGNGTFAPRVDYPLSNIDSSAVISAADMNSDGQNDLVVSGGTQVVVLLNMGGGAFAPAVAYGGGPMNAQCSAIGDFNADGRPDVARLVAASNPNSLEVMLNQGNGTLAPGVQFATVENANRDLVATDLNGDGYADFVIHGTNENVSVFINDGMGAAVFQPQPGLPFGWSIDGIVVEDINGDGYQDVTFSSPSSDTFFFGQVCLNDGHGVFRKGPGAPYGVSVAADLDGNGLHDLASAGNPFCVVLSDGVAKAGCYETLGGGLVAADIDGDSIPELIGPKGALHKVVCQP